MSNFIMKPRVFPAYSGAIHDTFVACKDTGCSPYKYAHGQAKPHFPVPATINMSDIAANWACISQCQCACCLEHFMDGLEIDFPQAFEGT